MSLAVFLLTRCRAKSIRFENHSDGWEGVLTVEQARGSVRTWKTGPRESNEKAMRDLREQLLDAAQCKDGLHREDYNSIVGLLSERN
jgi:hypothetical protein